MAHLAAFAFTLAQATGSLTCNNVPVVRFTPASIAAKATRDHTDNHAGCENATDEGRYAVFSPTAAANKHHRLVELPLDVSATGLWAATIHISGDFSQGSCDPSPPNGTAPECDLVAGLTDGTTVWAFSRGATFLDTQVPFGANATRPSTGHFYDAYARPPASDTIETGVPFSGWMSGGFVGVINATRPGVVLSKITSVNHSMAKQHWNAYTTPEHTPLAGSLSLVLYRDEPQQRYAISGINVTFQICQPPTDIYETELEECNEEEGYGEAAELTGGAAMGIGIFVIAQFMWRRYRTPASKSGLSEPLSPADLAYDPNDDDDVPLSLMMTA
jgi:hypothetical protein